MAGEIYKSDFLTGFSLPDSQEFDEWAFFRREALRSRLVQALERLIEAKIADGDPRVAVVHAMRLVGLDPLSESSHRHLIRAHLAAGDRRRLTPDRVLCKAIAEGTWHNAGPHHACPGA